MTQLIVALDVSPKSAISLPSALTEEAGVTLYKVGMQFLMEKGAHGIIEGLVGLGIDIFLDLKLYDTRDTVYAIARRAFDLGARFLSVHATSSMIEAAMYAKPPGARCKVLAVKHLTDQPALWPQDDLIPNGPPWFQIADGLVLPVWALKHIHPNYRGDKITVCPGIRAWLQRVDNHAHPAAPAEASAAGADYIIVGRPIYAAPDPVAAARTIMEELR